MNSGGAQWAGGGVWGGGQGGGWAGEMQQQYIPEDFREHAERMMHNVRGAR